MEINGQPVSVSKGVHRADRRPRTMLPGVCNQDDNGRRNCNGWLSLTVDQPGVPRLVTAIKELQPLTGKASVEDFARWWAKVLVLSRHPDAGQRFWKTHDGRFAGRSPWTPWPEDLLPEWRSTGALPSELSLWVMVYDRASGTEQLPDRTHLDLPHTFRSDGATDGGYGQVSGQAILLPNKSMLAVTLVFHPLMDFTHPFQEAGLAVRLWPDPPAQLDLTALPKLNGEGAEQWDSLFRIAHIAAAGVPAGRRLHLHAVGTGVAWPPCFDSACGQ